MRDVYDEALEGLARSKRAEAQTHTSEPAYPFEAAWKLHSLGYSVVPSGGGPSGKHPLVSWKPYQEHLPTDDEIRQWEDALHPHLWGIVTGQVVVFDCDRPEAMAMFDGLQPHVRTPRGGAHYYFKAERPVKTVAGLLPGLDVRGQGGFVNIVGNNGTGSYSVDLMPTPENVYPWDKVPAEILRVLEGPQKTELNVSGQSIPEGQRNSVLASLAGTMRRRGMAEEAIAAALLETNRSQCQPPLPEDEVRAIAASVGRYEPAPDDIGHSSVDSLSDLDGTNASQDDPERHLTDTGNAELVADLFGDRVRYDHRQQRWLLWNQHRWAPDRNGHVSRLAMEAARYRYHQSEKIADLKERQRVATWAISSEQRMRVDSCLALARVIEPIADTGDNWDRDIWLLGVPNGVVDLRSGELRPGKPEDRITMTTGVDFDPEATCPRWMQFLDEVFADAELIDWLHRALGYSLAGDTREQCVFIGHGSGSNGKSVFKETLHSVLGDYAYGAPFATFELHQRASIPNDLAALEFRRFVSSSETNDNTRLNEARVKAISGGDQITARYLHQEFFSFHPHLKLWLFVNHKPKVLDDSFGFWRRVRLIPFNRQFTGKDEDLLLAQKLRTEAPGILAWLVRGCLEWQKRGIQPVPECVKVATKEYQHESDPLGRFVSDCCVEHPQATVKASVLYETYRHWTEREELSGAEVMNPTVFGRRASLRWLKRKEPSGLYYSGVGLVAEDQGALC